MRLTRRTLIASSIGSAALASIPAALRAAPPGLLVADPALLTAAPPFGTIAASGTELMAALLSLMGQWQRIEAVLGDADAEMLSQMVRFQPGLRWSAVRAEAGVATFAGILSRPARIANAAVLNSAM